MRPQAEPSKDHQGQISALLHAEHQLWEEPPSRTLKCDSRRSWAHEFKDSKSNLLVCAQALSQKGAQSDHWQRPNQLVDGKHACPNKAEAACQVESPTLGMSFPRLPFS
jgi:hypothetical protein